MLSVPNGSLPIGKRKFEDEQDDAVSEALFGSESDSEEAHGDEDDDFTGPCEYHESSEHKPYQAAWDAEFPKIHEHLAKVAAKANRVCAKSGCDNALVQSTARRANVLQKFPDVRKKRVITVGRSGAGKSSLMNAVLGLPYMAKAVSNGQGCTNVSTSYESPLEDQDLPFAAEVEFFNIEEVRALLDNMLKDYELYHFGDLKEFEQTEHEALKRAAGTAFECFRQLFCDKAEFSSDDGDGEALRLFTEWSQKLIKKHSRAARCDAGTEREILGWLDQYVSKTSQPKQPYLWPIVRHVRVGIEGLELLKYFTLVDVPGLGDINQVRAKAFEAQVHLCDEIWVVATIDRVTTDDVVDMILARYGASIKIVIITTGIDTKLNKALADDLVDEGRDVGAYYELHKEEVQLSRAVRKAQKSLEQTMAIVQDARDGKRARLSDGVQARADAKIQKLQTELQSLEPRLAVVSQEVFDLLVEARNTSIKEMLAREKSDQLPKGSELCSFFVSSTHYAALKGAEVITGPRLSAEKTGIPGIRRYLYEAAGPAVVQALEHYIDHRFEVFLEGLRLWAHPVDRRGCELALELVKESQKVLESRIGEYIGFLERTTEERLLEPFQAGDETYKLDALKVIEDKRKWAYGSIKAFVYHDGAYSTKSQRAQNWNGQFFRTAAKEIEQRWSDLHAVMTHYFKQYSDALIETADHIPHQLEACEAGALLDLGRVQDLLQGHRNGLAKVCEQFALDAEKGLRNVKDMAVKTGELSYFTNLMGGAYTEAQEISGNGAKARMLQIFNTHLSLEPERSPFMAVAAELRKAINANTKDCVDILQEGYAKFIQDVRDELEPMFTKQEDTPEELKLREQLRFELPDLQTHFQDIKLDLKKIKRCYEL